jgi:CRP-like cAMP-binding protein
MDSKGIERNLQFVAENDWVLEIDSFYNERPGRVYVEAIEPSVVLQIKRPDLIYLFQNASKPDKYFRVITEKRFAQQENRILEAISSTAEERYLSFIKQYPNLLSRLPGIQIASYLGITPEFLSKIRKDIAKK